MADKVVWCDIGWMPVNVGFCPSVAVLAKEYKRLTKQTYDEGVSEIFGRTIQLRGSDGSNVVLVVLGGVGADNALEVMLTLVHEAVHVWQNVCAIIGEDRPGRETEAYSIERISRALIEAYCSTTGKGKSWL